MREIAHIFSTLPTTVLNKVREAKARGEDIEFETFFPKSTY